MNIGERIKNRRIELGLTQTELAHRMGLTSKTTICKAETTDFNPTTDRVREFAKALDCTPSYLMGWENTKSEQPETSDSISHMVEYGKKFADLFKNYSQEDLSRVLGIVTMYEKAPDDVRRTIDMILKSTQQKP